MSIIAKMEATIARIEKQDVTLENLVRESSVKNVTDTHIATGVDRLLYNHAVNKTEAAEICGTSMPTFNQVEAKLLEEGAINRPFKQGNATMYNLFDLKVFMDAFEVPKYRDKYRPLVFNVGNHKGGVGKTSTLRTLATAFALDKVLNPMVCQLDLDPQGSLSVQIIPSENAVYVTVADIQLRNLDPDSPLNQYIEAYSDTHTEDDIIFAAAGQTHLPNLYCYSAFPSDEKFTDFYHSLETAEEKNQLIAELSTYLIPKLKEKFDIIFLDTPPQDSPITWSALLATDVLITPIAPKMLDYLSTRNFIRFTKERIQQIGADKNIIDWKVLPVMVRENDLKHERMMGLITETLADVCMSNEIALSDLFTSADSVKRSIYDIQKTECKDRKWASRAQYDAAINSSNAVYRELKKSIPKWAKK
ncbi:ParA family protein [Vibrio breoganii]